MVKAARTLEIFFHQLPGSAGRRDRFSLFAREMSWFSFGRATTTLVINNSSPHDVLFEVQVFTRPPSEKLAVQLLPGETVCAFVCVVCCVCVFVHERKEEKMQK